MSETAGLLGLPVEFEFGGKVLKIAPRDFSVEGLFSLWVEQQALRSIQRHRDTLLVSEYEMMLAAHTRDCAAQRYEWGESICFNAAWSTPGRKHLYTLQLSKGMGANMTPTRKLVEAIFADPAARPAFEAAVARANPDPNAASPAEAEAGA